MRRRVRSAAALCLALLLAGAVPVRAAEIKVLSGNGSRGPVSELCAQFERATGHKVNVTFAVNPEVWRRLAGGEDFDVSIINPPVLDELITQGRIVAGTRALIGRAGSGVSIGELAFNDTAST